MISTNRNPSLSEMKSFEVRSVGVVVEQLLELCGERRDEEGERERSEDINKIREWRHRPSFCHTRYELLTSVGTPPSIYHLQSILKSAGNGSYWLGKTIKLLGVQGITLRITSRVEGVAIRYT